MQINHPGRQVFKKMGGKVLSPSNIPLEMGKHSNLFTTPTPMTNEEIEEVIQRFATTAEQAKKAGFDGVEIHAAHGYLLAQFLSPLTNKRNDQWGGSLNNRARLLLEIAKRIRTLCGQNFDIAIKLNSADFQRGGFEVEDAIKVIEMLEPFNVDMVELSGGSYEAPAMQGRTADNRTLAREAYFLEFAEKIALESSIPIMTTGGITKLNVANKVINRGVDLVGIASALAFTPDLPNSWQTHNSVQGHVPTLNWQDKTLNGLAVMAMVKHALRAVGKGKKPSINTQPLWVLIKDQIRAKMLTNRYRKQYRDELN
jgi:2,4-dienoyl-CoA reductase-like NADH-dependent reductase (Old Yellow Enzyme family)